MFSEEEVGTKYNLWTSFIDSRFYAITTKESPHFTNVLGYANGENILFEAELSEGHAVKYYWLDIYEGETLVETTRKIFMSKLSYYYRKARPGRKYHAVFHVVTQDGMTNQEDAIWWKSGTPTNKTDECSLVSISQNAVGGVATYFDSAKQAMRITALGEAVATGTLKSGTRVDLSSFYIDPGLSISAANKVVLFSDGCAYEVKSYNSSTGELVIKAPVSKYYAGGEKYTICADKPDSSCYYKILRTGDGGTSFAGSYKTNVVYDYTCESGASYTYVVLPYKINTQSVSEEKKIANYYPETTVDVVIPKKKCWAIYGLLPTAYTRITNDDTRIFYGYQDQFSDGYYSTANGDYDVVIGEQLITPSTGNNRFVVGRYNDKSIENMLFVIGNGDTKERSNAFSVDKEGNVYCKGTITSGGAATSFVPYGAEQAVESAKSVFASVMEV